MALIQADSQGQVYRVTTVPAHADQYRNDPDAAQTLDLDPATNADLLQDASLHTARYTIVAGVLKKDGQDVLVNPDGDDGAVVRFLLSVTAQERTALVQGAKGFMQAMKNGQNPTTLQSNRALAYALLQILERERNL